MDEWEELRQLIVDKGIKLDKGINSNGSPCHWLIDCREVMLIPRGAYLISKLMYEKFKTFRSKNVGGLTLAANPLVSFMVLLAYQDKKPISGFIIRKEPKYNGLQKLIEGDFKPGEKVVLVDDLINSGGTIFSAIKTTEENGCKVEGVLTIINFGNRGLKELRDRGYRAEYLFELEDLFIKNKSEEGKIKEPNISWSLDDTNKWQVSVPRSSPALYRDSLLFGTNEGRFLSVNTETGKINWSLDLSISNPKGILSSPVLYGEKVFFGAYDGYLYCLNVDNGKIIWKTRTGEWIGSSPCIYDEKVFVGLEYGTRGGSLCAYSIENGKLLWNLRTKHYIHSSPAIDKEHNVVVIGCNDGRVYAADTKTGRLLWEYFIGKETKAGFAIDEKNGLVYFGSFDGNMHCLDIKNGNIKWKRRVGRIVYSTPEIINDYLVFSTVSARIFVLNKENGSIKWFYNTQGRIFSNTQTIENQIFCGSDDGYLYVLDLDSGKLIKKYEIGKEILTKPLIYKDKIYLGCKGKFVCIKL